MSNFFGRVMQIYAWMNFTCTSMAYKYNMSEFVLE